LALKAIVESDLEEFVVEGTESESEYWLRTWKAKKAGIPDVLRG
jgi:hypothetical protein